MMLENSFSPSSLRLLNGLLGHVSHAQIGCLTHRIGDAGYCSGAIIRLAFICIPADLLLACVHSGHAETLSPKSPAEILKFTLWARHRETKAVPDPQSPVWTCFSCKAPASSPLESRPQALLCPQRKAMMPHLLALLI